MKKIRTTLDYVFITIIVFLFFCVWCNFHFRSISKTFIPAILLTIIFMCIAHIFLKQRREKQAEIIKEKKEAAQTFLELLHLKSPEVLIKKAFAHQSSTFVFCKISKNPLTEQDLVTAVTLAKEKKQNEIAFFCEKAGTAILFFSKNYANFKIDFYDAAKIHNILKDANLLPPTTIKTTKQKINFKQFLSLLISPEKCKSYFLVGFFLAFSCLFTPYKTYYAVFATLFFALAVATKFKAKQNA